MLVIFQTFHNVKQNENFRSETKNAIRLSERIFLVSRASKISHLVDKNKANMAAGGASASCIRLRVLNERGWLCKASTLDRRWNGFEARIYLHCAGECSHVTGTSLYEKCSLILILWKLTLDFDLFCLHLFFMIQSDGTNDSRTCYSELYTVTQRHNLTSPVHIISLAPLLVKTGNQ